MIEVRLSGRGPGVGRHVVGLDIAPIQGIPNRGVDAAVVEPREGGADQLGVIFRHAQRILSVLRGEHEAVFLGGAGRVGDIMAVDVAACIRDLEVARLVIRQADVDRQEVVPFEQFLELIKRLRSTRALDLGQPLVGIEPARALRFGAAQR